MELLAIFDAQTFFQWFVEHASYILVFTFMVIESSFIPFPSEVVVPPAAYLAVVSKDNLPQGFQVADMNIVAIIIVATLGALVGSLVNYYLSLWIGRPVVYSFAESRLGHAFMLDKKKVEKAEQYFDKHGAISTFIGRLIPAVRQLISIPAGIARMDIKKFCTYTVLGAGLWNVVLALLGLWLAKAVPLSQLFEMVEKYNSYLTYIGIGILVFCILLILWNAFKPRPEDRESGKKE